MGSILCCCVVSHPDRLPHFSYVESDFEGLEDLNWLGNRIRTVSASERSKRRGQSVIFIGGDTGNEHKSLSPPSAKHSKRSISEIHHTEIMPVTESDSDSLSSIASLRINVSRPCPIQFDEFKWLVEEKEELAVNSEFKVDIRPLRDDASLRCDPGTSPTPTSPDPLPVLNISSQSRVRRNRFQPSSQIWRDPELFARRILVADAKESDHQDFSSVLTQGPAINLNVSSDEALAPRIQEQFLEYNHIPEQSLSLRIPIVDLELPRLFHFGEHNRPLDLGQRPRLGRRDAQSFRDLYSHFEPIPRRYSFESPVEFDGLFHNDSVGRNFRGVQQSIIDELPTRKFVERSKPEDEKTREVDSSGSESNIMCCCVCMEVFKTSENVRTLPCLHFYHTKCIDKWLSANRTCPICKFDVTKTSRDLITIE